jgi:hypothetical protein
MTRWSQLSTSKNKFFTSYEVEILPVVCLDAMMQIYIYIYIYSAKAKGNPVRPW